MFASQSTWQLRRCGSPLIATRHSKHVPMPQRGERGWPVTDVRQVAPEARTATATVAPARTVTGFPFTRTETDSDMGLRGHLPGRQIGLNRNCGTLAENLRADQLGCRERGGDAQTLVACRD
jgi:hypothetical protein